MFEYLLADFGVKVPSRELRLGSTHLSGTLSILCSVVHGGVSAFFMKCVVARGAAL